MRLVGYWVQLIEPGPWGVLHIKGTWGLMIQISGKGRVPGVEFGSAGRGFIWRTVETHRLGRRAAPRGMSWSNDILCLLDKGRNFHDRIFGLRQGHHK